MKFTLKKKYLFGNSGLWVLAWAMIFSFSTESMGQQLEAMKPVQDPAAKFIDAKKLQLTGQRDKAIEAFETLYKADRQNDAVAFELAKLYDDKSDVLLTRKYIESALRSSPDNLYYNDFYAHFLFKTEEYEKVFKPLDILLQNYKDDLSYIDLGLDAAIRLKDKAAGNKYLGILLEHYGKSEKALTRTFEYYDQTADPRAESVLLELTDRYASNKSYLKLLASWYASHQQKDRSIETYRKVLEIDPNDTDANLVVLETSQKTEEQGIAYLRSLFPLIKNPSIDLDAKIRELLPFLRQASQQRDSALILALSDAGEQLILVHPTEAKAHAFYADVLWNGGQAQNAVRQYEKTLDLDDTNWEIWEQLMSIYLQNEDNVKLESKAYEAYDLFPNQVLAYYFYGKALINNKKAAEAIEVANEGSLVAAGNATALSKLETVKAESALLQQKPEVAKKSIDLALQYSQNQNPMAVKLLGDYLNQTGAREEAQKAWKQAMDMGYQFSKEQLFMRGIRN